MGNYTVRPAEYGDEDSIAFVASQSWKHTYGSIYPQDVIKRFLSMAYSAESLHVSISSDSERTIRLFYVAIDSDHNMVGYSQSMPESGSYNSLELLRIYALPDSLGKGVGTALLNYLFQECPDAMSLSAWVEDRNATGRRFYERHGFTVQDEKYEDLFGYRTRQLKYCLTWHSR